MLSIVKEAQNRTLGKVQADPQGAYCQRSSQRKHSVLSRETEWASHRSCWSLVLKVEPDI